MVTYALGVTRLIASTIAAIMPRTTAHNHLVGISALCFERRLAASRMAAASLSDDDGRKGNAHYSMASPINRQLLMFPAAQ